MVFDTGHGAVDVEHRIQRGECLIQDTEGRVLDTGYRGVSVGHRIQSGGCWTRDTEG